MNPAILSRLFAAQQEPQWGPNPYPRPYNPQEPVKTPPRTSMTPSRAMDITDSYYEGGTDFGEEDMDAAGHTLSANGLQSFEDSALPDPVWKQHGEPFQRGQPGLNDLMPMHDEMAQPHFVEQAPGNIWANKGASAASASPMADMWDERAPQSPASYDDHPASQPPAGDMYSLDRVEDEGYGQPLGVVEADEGRTFDYNMGALPPGTQPGGEIPADYFGPMHGPPHVMMGPGPIPEEEMAGVGPKITGAPPLGEMFGPQQGAEIMEQLPPGLESRTSLGLGYEGMLEPGNIDLTNRPDVLNADGSHSSVRSMSFNAGGPEALVPTVSEDARIMGDEEAMGQYRDTGRHLGMFDTPDNATAYADALHNQQAGTPQGPLMSGAPLGGMFGPPAPEQPPSLPRMTSRR